MSKELPYFKFIATEWLTGNICYEPFEVQGLFINICALYWNRGGILQIYEIEQRYKKKSVIAKLSGRFFSLSEGYIKIDFLDEQLSERQRLSENNSKNGRKGGIAKSLKNVANAKRNPSETIANCGNIEEEKEKEKKSKNKIFLPPTIFEVKDYFKQNGYTEQSGEKAFNYYNIADWKDSKGNKVKNWKQKMVSVWFKEENKIQIIKRPLC